MMIIQSTRYLKKLYTKFKKGEKIDIQVMDYINNLDRNVSKVCSARTVEELCTLDQIVEALEVNASHSILSTFDKMEKASDKPRKVLENDIFALDLLKLGVAHL